LENANNTSDVFPFVIQLRAMRVLLISDIHANLVALNAVLAAAGDHDAVWCLGDVVGYGPAPNECVERLRELDPICLAGNHDWATLGKLDIQEFNPDARRAILWTRAVLKPENRDWLTPRPDSTRLPRDDIALVHGSPRRPIWEYILSTSTAAENMTHFDTSVCLFGHTHVPMLYRQEGDDKQVKAQRLVEGEPLSLVKKMLLNPGSVGQPRDRDPRAAYAVIELETRTLTYHRIGYDIAATQHAMIEANLPRRLIERLNYGV
jgi:predicted phosphodiesterase